MRETVATGNVHVQTKPGLTAGISGNIKTLDLLLQLLEAGIELFIQLQINIYLSLAPNDDGFIHTCPEGLIQLSELCKRSVNGFLVQFGNISRICKF